ncbi:MAG: Holliday junction resolvase RuvX [Gammaproteobacteria bacterium HGW-Gammaproteobacteria-8]|nr:MAG: Holliday junction resolvase RuvX [Gammaproteobacteria bacterium HGW-Gammaproteobacteria-8]
MPEARPSVVLGLDFGLRRIGVASGNTLTGTARPLATVHHQGEPWPALERLIREWRPGRIIIGLPLRADGSDSDISRAVRAFGRELEQRHPDLQLQFQDERHSSQAAGSRFVEARRSGQARRKDAANLDSVAAALIVESWLAERALDPA